MSDVAVKPASSPTSKKVVGSVVGAGSGFSVSGAIVLLLGTLPAFDHSTPQLKDAVGMLVIGVCTVASALFGGWFRKESAEFLNWASDDGGRALNQLQAAGVITADQEQRIRAFAAQEAATVFNAGQAQINAHAQQLLAQLPLMQQPVSTGSASTATAPIPMQQQPVAMGGDGQSAPVPTTDGQDAVNEEAQGNVLAQQAVDDVPADPADVGDEVPDSELPQLDAADAQEDADLEAAALAGIPDDVADAPPDEQPPAS